MSFKHYKKYLLSIACVLIILTGGYIYHTYNTYRPDVLTNDEIKYVLAQPEKYAVIDVRNKLEYDRGHIPGAIHANYHDPQSLTQAAQGKIPITYCTYSAWRGPYAAYLLYKNGFRDVGVLTGGIKSWQEGSRPLQTELSDETPFVYPHPEKDLLFPHREIAATESATETVEFNVMAKQFSFTPSIIQVRKGQKVVLHLSSIDVPHGFALPEYHIVEEILPKQTKRIEFVADRAGIFPFLCSVYCGVHSHSGESHMSMVGELHVQ